MSKGTEQPPWDAREAFHRSAMAVYANLGALLAIIWRDRDLRVTLRVFDEHVVPYSAPDTGDPELVADLKHATVRLRSSLAAAEEIRGTHRQATRAFGKHGGSFGGVSTTSHHDALIAAANLVLDADEDPVLRQQVLKEGIDPAAWARLKENLENEFKLAQIEPPVPDGSRTQPLDVLTIFKEMDFMWLSIAEGIGDGADEAYDALFGPENFHAQLLALAGRIDELKERFRGDVHKIADFAVTSGHEAAAIFAGRIAQFARARKRWIPQHRQDLRQAEAAGDKVKILRAQHDLREGIRGFAKFMTPAFKGWDEHRAWMRRSIEAEGTERRRPPSAPRTCVVERTGTDRAVVKEGETKVIIKGPRRVWLLLEVSTAGKHLSWNELVKGDIQNAGVVMDRRTRSRSASGQDNPSNGAGTVRRGASSPRFATKGSTLQNLGTRIRKDLGKLAYHWQQDGQGVVWSADCQ